LLDNLNITDIFVNGHKEVWIDQGQGLEKTKLTFLNEESVRSLAQKLALSTGVASVLSVKHKANHAAEEAALIAASTLDCSRAVDIAQANGAEILNCNINTDHVYIETFSRFNNAQLSLFKQLGINDDGVIGKAKAK
jgi:hypothetical protein